MTFERQVARALDDEHRTNMELLNRVEQGFARVARAGVTHDAELAGHVAALGRELEQEVARHFAFEEQEIFPRMQDAGDGDMASLLMEEHVAINDVTREFVPLARRAAAGTLDDAGWTSLRRLALEIIERLSAHINKETMALLPLLEQILDEDDDRELAFAYASA